MGAIDTRVDAPAHAEQEYMFEVDLGAEVAEKTGLHWLWQVKSGTNRAKLGIFVSLER